VQLFAPDGSGSLPGHARSAAEEAVAAAESCLADVNSCLQRVPLFSLMVAYDEQPAGTQASVPHSDTSSKGSQAPIGFERAVVINSSVMSWLAIDSSKPVSGLSVACAVEQHLACFLLGREGGVSTELHALRVDAWEERVDILSDRCHRAGQPDDLGHTIHGSLPRSYTV
jgi:hypothetical protein